MDNRGNIGVSCLPNASALTACFDEMGKMQHHRSTKMESDSLECRWTTTTTVQNRRPLELVVENPRYFRGNRRKWTTRNQTSQPNFHAVSLLASMRVHFFLRALNPFLTEAAVGIGLFTRVGAGGIRRRAAHPRR